MNKIGLNTARLNTALLNAAYTNGSTADSTSSDAKKIMDSLVCWYDPGKQQCTNESMAANPVLADLSGNGHDIECFNFGWSGMSGIGGYINNRNVDKWWKPSSNNGTYIIKGNTIHISKLNTNKEFYYVTNNCDAANEYIELQGNTYTTKPFNIKISGLPEGKQVKISGLAGAMGDSTYNTSFPFQYFNNGTFTVESVSCIWENDIQPDTFNFPNFFIDSDTADDVDITIELLPEYPNALVSDGVDDYAYVEGLPILTDYTVIAKREWIKTEYNDYSALAGKTKSSAGGAFIFERRSPDISDHIYNFGVPNTIDIGVSKDTYQTSSTYNGSNIYKGSFIDDDCLSLFSDRAGSHLSQAALYSFLLFDRDLTEQEIEWVKKNMIESGGVLKTDWSDSSLWAFYNIDNQGIIDGTISSNKMVITANGKRPDAAVIANFMEVIVQNSMVPAYKIKVTGLKNGIVLTYYDRAIAISISEDGIYSIPEHNAQNRYFGYRFNKAFENENIVIQQLLS